MGIVASRQPLRLLAITTETRQGIRPLTTAYRLVPVGDVVRWMHADGQYLYVGNIDSHNVSSSDVDNRVVATITWPRAQGPVHVAERRVLYTAKPWQRKRHRTSDNTSGDRPDIRLRSRATPSRDSRYVYISVAYSAWRRSSDVDNTVVGSLPTPRDRSTVPLPNADMCTSRAPTGLRDVINTATIRSRSVRTGMVAGARRQVPGDRVYVPTATPTCRCSATVSARFLTRLCK